ncbi:MAG: hypothetical protein HND44_17580 [Chloroflexi bacterium]|nr:hypothetical protein [Ardenticatenaceae bacterium]MBL1130265.1 hypothetical protein [Chloroflexota bacterium]NOG36357.1 hypothetical protein [Chloroflexota bacterium]GIK56333.1 MAG: hypothetical protein BroJett015_19960 [Chloroflexota bacterium]
MRPVEELQVWKDRWQTLDTTMSDLLAKYGEHGGPDFPRKATIYHLLQRLRSFGKSHFTYFYQGFLADSPLTLHEDREKYPPAAVLRSIIDQIAFDLEVIERAWNQRLAGTAVMKQALQLADALGQLALQPAIHGGAIPADVTVLTYFQKSTSVRVIPYADVAIVGLPFTAIHISRDFLAIPHEVAHYVYRHGNHNRQPISTFLQDKTKHHPKYLRNWLEETFADVYGCLVAGPVMAIDFQDLQLDDPIDEFTKAYIDYEDPVPVIRPDIYTKTLVNSDVHRDTGLALLLETRWRGRRDSYLGRSEETKTPITFTTTNQTLSLEDVRSPGGNLDTNNKPLDGMVQEILNMLSPWMPADLAYPRWSGDENSLSTICEAAQLPALYTNFDQFKNGIEVVHTPRDKELRSGQYPHKLVILMPDLSPDTKQLESSLELEAAGLTPGIDSLWVNWAGRWAQRNGAPLGELLAERRPNRIPRDNKGEWGWIELAYADGWATRGPEPNPVGG